jgi:translation initiation factor IF-3
MKRIFHSQIGSKVIKPLFMVSSISLQPSTGIFSVYSLGNAMRFKSFFVNDKIPKEYIRLILQDGKDKGKVSLKDALKSLLEHQQLRMVSDGEIPVCKVFELNKPKVSKPKKKQQNKEIEFTTNIAIGDFNTKVNRINSFLLKGINVNVKITAKGDGKVQELFTLLCENVNGKAGKLIQDKTKRFYNFTINSIK